MIFLSIRRTELLLPNEVYGFFLREIGMGSVRPLRQSEVRDNNIVGNVVTINLLL